MKKQENLPIRSPEDMLAQAETLAAACLPLPGTAAPQVSSRWQRLPQWCRNLLWALGGAGTVGLCWLSWAFQ